MSVTRPHIVSSRDRFLFIICDISEPFARNSSHAHISCLCYSLTLKFPFPVDDVIRQGPPVYPLILIVPRDSYN